MAKPGQTPGLSAVVVAGEEETRVLLRGLLRLHHCRVVGEAEGATHALDLVRDHRPPLLLVDAKLAEGSAEALLQAIRSMDPRPRVILVAPPTRAGLEGPPADAVLHRPFRIREFSDALGEHLSPDGSS